MTQYLRSQVPGIVASATGHLAAGNVPMKLFSCVALGSTTGAACGAHASLNFDEAALRDLFMASLVVLGGRSLYGAGRNVQALLKARAKGP